MIKDFYITGDTHRAVKFRIEKLLDSFNISNPEETALIILGDVGINYFLDSSDDELKNRLSQYGITLYCLRGNHEARPQDLEDIEMLYDNNINGYVYYQPSWPLIRYFVDGAIYLINNHRVLTIGGAYSIDKQIRLQRAGLQEADNNPKLSSWFHNEQLDGTERILILNSLIGEEPVDFVFTHTCPTSWEPSDLFLGFVNQDEVDKSMEYFLDTIKNKFEWKIWCFGHFHDDRLERPNVEQYYYCINNLEDIWNRWRGNRTIEQDEWYLPKSPNYRST